MTSLLQHELIEPIRDPEILDRVRTTFDLYAAAEEMTRRRLRREDPDASDVIIERRLDEWRLARTKAPMGDSSGPKYRRVPRSEWTIDSSTR